MVLVVFTLSSIALVTIKIKQGKKEVGKDVFCIPLFIPCLAIILNLIAIAFLPLQDIIPAAVFIGLGSIITWLVMKSLNILK